MGILEIFKKKENFIAGLNINSDGVFELIELKKINNSYFPIFAYSGILENFTYNGIFKKKKFINIFKELKKEIKSEKIFLNSFENKKLENEIKSALKISGFSNISIKNQNINGIILTSYYNFQKMSVYFSKNEIFFTTTENEKIIKQDKIKVSDFKVSLVAKLTSHLKQKHIFLSGIKPFMIEPVTGVFYQANIKVHLQNIWENFLDFSDGIPALFPEESQEFITVLSITVPNLKKWKAPSYGRENAKKDIKKENILESTEVFLPKPKKKVYLKKSKKERKSKSNSKEKESIHSVKTKKRQVKENPKNIKKLEKGLEYNIEKSEKLYLPKRFKKYLPKPKEEGVWKKVKNILNSEI